MFAIWAYSVLPIDLPQYLLHLQGIGTGGRACVQEQIQDQVSTLWSELASTTEEPERPLQTLRGDEAGAEESTEAAVSPQKLEKFKSVDSQNWKGRWQNRARCMAESGIAISGDSMGPCCKQKPR